MKKTFLSTLFLFLATISVLFLFSCSPNSGQPANKVEQSDLDRRAYEIMLSNLNRSDAWLGELKNRKFEPGKLNVGYVTKEAVEELLKVLKGSKIVGEIPELKVVQLELKGLTVEEAYKILKQRKVEGIRYVEPNYVDRKLPVVIPDQKIAIKSVQDFVKESSANLLSTETEDSYVKFQYGLSLIKAPEVWDEASGTNVVVAVLDTGVDGTHPDLQGQIHSQYVYIGSWKQVSNPNMNTDTHGHGTHCAGIIAAKKGGGKTIGIAPNAKIMSIRIFNPGYIGEFPVAQGIVLAVNQGAHVLSNSWGGGGYSNLLKDAFDYAIERNVIVVASAGNDYTDQSWHYPSGYTGVIAVAASNVRDRVTEFSSRGEYVSVAAPGDYVLAPMATDRSSSFAQPNDPYAYWSGTSMAGPHVAGLAALLRQKYPHASVFEIKRMIEKGAKDIETPGFDNASGYGRIDAKASLAINPSSEKLGTLFVYATDRDGVNIPDVYVTIKNKSTGRTYKEKAYIQNYSDAVVEDEEVYAVAKFYGIELGEYDIIVGGPDFLSMDVPIYRIEEQVMATSTVKLTADENVKTLRIVLKSKNFGFYLQPSHEPGENTWQGNIVYEIYRLDNPFNPTIVEVVDSVVTTDGRPVEFNLNMVKRDEKAAPYYAVAYRFIGTTKAIARVSEDFEDGSIDLPNVQLLGHVLPAIINLPPWATTGNSSTKVLALGDAAGTNLLDNQMSELKFSVQLDKEAILTFRYVVSSENNYDWLNVYVNGSRVFRDSGIKETWRNSPEIVLKPGVNEIRITYEKDFIISSGRDSVLIDDIVIGEPLKILGHIKINGCTVPVAVSLIPGNPQVISNISGWSFFYLF